MALGIIAVAAQLVLVWGFAFFPSIDGPAHVHLAHAFLEALRGDAFYGSLVELNGRLNPNLATQGMMVALMAIAPPPVAEKIWLSLYLISFAAAGAYVLYGINRNSLCLLPLLAFCSISFPLAFGFYNFSFSTVVFLAWFGYWWRHRHSISPAVILGHAAMALLAYATHIFAFMVSLLGIGLATLGATLLQAFRSWKAGSPLSLDRLRPVLTHALPPVLGSIPELIASLYFLFGRFGSQTVAGAAGLSIAETGRFKELLTASSFAPYDGFEVISAVAFVVVLLLLLLYFLRRGANVSSSIPLAVCFAGFLLVYLVVPQQWIVRWMPARFQPLVFIALLLWLAALVPIAMKSSAWKVIGTSGLALLMLSVSVRFDIFTRIDGYYREFTSVAPRISGNSTLIALRLHNSYRGKPFPAKMDVLIQAGSRIASMRHSVDLKNFQGHSRDHPIQFRPGVSATAALGGDRAIISLPPRITLMEYERRTDRPIDYVLVYGFREEVNNLSALQRLESQLEESYRLIQTSEPLGLVRLYERHDPTGTASHGR